VARALDLARPDAIVNCIGLVKQHARATDPEANLTINARFPHRLARLAAARGARLVHLSTDCVFSGRTGGYREDDDLDAPDLYGRTKALGEVSGDGVLTLRTSMVGRELRGAHGLVEWFLAQRGTRVRGYTRAFFSGMTTRVLSEAIVDVVAKWPELSGIYHVAADRISKHDLLQLLNEAFGTKTTIEPDASVTIDRSLCGDRFREATGWGAPSWSAMVAALAAEHERTTGVSSFGGDA
jgi:dTDP-4-dehydrorhamnose reductase